MEVGQYDDLIGRVNDMESRLRWEKNGGAYIAWNVDGEELGWLELERVGAHMHWYWYQEHDIRMSPGCLQEVRDKQKELFNKGRGKRRPQQRRPG